MTELDPKFHNRLTRYLHTGTEIPIYFPGCWTSHKYFTIDNLPVLNEILANNQNNIEIVNIILKTYRDGWYSRFDTIAFALAKCLLLGNNKVKEVAYKAAIEICKTPEEMMLFSKFTKNLKSGSGQGWCKSVRAWYLQKEPMDLAKEMTRVKGRHGRSHSILLRKSHIKIDPEDIARDAVVKYTFWGLKRAKQMVKEIGLVKEIYDYIKKVEDLRHCEDPVAAAVMVKNNQYTLDHVPGHLLTSQDVWNAVLPQFNLRELLTNIQRIHNMGFLSSDSTTTAIVLSMLNNKDILKGSDVSPIEVYITMCNYKKKSRPLKHEKAKVALEKEQRRRTRQVFDSKTGQWEWTVTRRHPKEVKLWGIDQLPNQAVLTALNKLIDHTWLLTAPTGVSFMITLDMRPHMFQGRHFCKTNVNKKSKKSNATATATKPTGAGGDAEVDKKIGKKRLHAECFYNTNVTPGHAAIILALQILKREKNVKLAVFSDEGVDIITTGRQFGTIDEAEIHLKKAKLGKVQLDAPIKWATENKHKVDVFIDMVDRTTRYMELDVSARGGRGPGGRFGPPPAPEKDVPDHCPVRALYAYREAVNVPDAKLVVMSLASHRVGTTDGSHEGVLDVVGIDEYVPKVINAFALNRFN